MAQYIRKKAVTSNAFAKNQMSKLMQFQNHQEGAEKINMST